MAAVVGNDIDSFILEQKAKLASERQSLAGSRATTPKGTGLPLSNRESLQRRQQLATQPRQEYNQFLEKLDERLNSSRNTRGQQEEKQQQYKKSRQKEQEQQQYRDTLAQQVEEKRCLQLHQSGAGAPQPDVSAYHPRLDQDFSRPPHRDSTFTVGTHDGQREREVPRLTLPPSTPGQSSQKSPRSQTHHRDTGASRQRLESRQPGGRGDGAHAFDWRVERELSEMEYRDLWKEMHGSPQGGEDEKANRKWKRREVFNPQASVNTYEQQKRALQEERKQEMQSFLQQKKEEHEDQSQRRRWKEDREGGKAIPNSDDLAEAARRNLAEDRRREYLAMQEKSEKKGERRRWEVPETALAEKPLQLGEYEQVQQQFQRERQQDYKKMLQSQKPGNRTWKEPTEERLLPVGQNEGKKKQLEVERNQEYNEYLKSKDSGNRTWREPSAEKLLPLGDYEQKRRAVEEARKTEYQEFLRKQNTERRNLAHLTDEYKANVTFPGKNESDNAKNDKSEWEWKRKIFKRDKDDFVNIKPYSNGGFEWEWKRKIFKRDKDDFVDIKPYSINKERERNEEYNQFLREKDGGRRTSRTPDGQKPEFTASLPGLRNSDSAKKRKEQQRNAEYNLYLQSQRLPAKTGDPGKPPFTPRNVWATPVPSYDELLDKKRQQESRYRRTNDPSYDRPLESERKLAELDKELDWKKARYRNERLSQGVLDDPSWLSPRKQSSDAQYEDLLSRLKGDGKPRRRNTAQEDPSSYYASLPIGPESAEYQKKRQQDQYRKDLENQIREAAEGKQREKAMDLNVDYSGYIDPEVRKATSLVMASSTRRQRQTPARAYNTTLMDSLEKLDQISPRSEVILGRRRLDEFTQGGRVGGGLSLNRGTSRGGGIGVLDTGFETMIDTPRHTSLDPPPGLQYQPASYVTQGGGGGLGLSSVDEAYSFYATRNPLEDVPDFFCLGANCNSGGDGDGRGGGGGGRRNMANQELSFAGGGGGGGGGGRGGRGGRVRFEEERRSGRGMDFPSDEDKKRTEQLKAQAYHDELNRQIEENKRKKMKEREEKERYDRRIEQEARDYNPYGRGGGGAPMRDPYGNLVTDLRSMHRDNENVVDSPRRPPTNAYASPRGPATSIRDDLIGPPPVQTTAEGEQSYARGGHGIFGMPKTDSEKIASERYKSDLMRQIEEKRYEELKKKEKEREEEERQQKRVEEQQRRMQQEYEEERKRVREKEEEARRKNEELVRFAEERKREAELRRREAEDRRLEEQRQEREAEEATRVSVRRRDSPPVPAARTRTEPQPSTSRDDPPPPARAQSADVLNQLAAMRKQLQNERQRVETMLENERNDPDVFDPRLVQRPPPAPVVRPEIDVFETARSRNAAPVRRTPAERPNTQAGNDFNSLKFKEDSDSRKEFRRLFPDQPSTGDNLEAQQAALLRQQEENLRRLRDDRQNDLGYPKTSARLPPPPSRNQSQTPKQLLSSSAFVDVGSLNGLPDDFDDIPASRRNESARARWRGRRDSSATVASRADPFGSTTSLNVDRLAKKNEERLKKLRELQGDDVSLYDPDDVLDRFMSKQAHNRHRNRRGVQHD